MKKLKRYDETNARKPMKEYFVLLNGEAVAKTMAVSPKKAINNVRWNNYISQYIFDYDMEDFDVIEI